MTDQITWEQEQAKRYEAELTEVSEILQRKIGHAVGLLCCAAYLELLFDENSVPDFRYPVCEVCGEEGYCMDGTVCDECKNKGEEPDV